jgi:uncharacterized protein (TIGR02231 family)
MLEAEATTMLTLLLALSAADPTPLPTTIREVTLYSDTALVRRAGTLAASGEYVIQGLPACLDPNNVRVRCEGGDVVNVETRERLQQTLPSERLQALREKLKALQREQQLAQDETGTWKQLAVHLEHMRSAEAAARAGEGTNARPSVEAWTANFEFLAKKSSEVSRAQRENAWKLEDIAERSAAAQKELGAAQSQGAVKVYDVRVSVEARGQAALDLEYLVSNTGWQPAYDLRAQKTLDKVELAYRAQVWQRTGEDWNEVALSLSSARPQIGAQGPEPVAAWVGIEAPRQMESLGYVGEKKAEAGRRLRKNKDLKALAENEAEDAAAAPAPRPFAAVESEGLSVRFQLPKPATIQSRAEPTTLLVGNATLAISAERQCVPALDTTVWLRGKAKNTSPWTMLPGTAAVFFGADYLGPAQIGSVQPGQELVLHLGADPGLTVKREQTEDMNKGPGFLSSTSSDTKSWRVHLENHGTLGAAADGSVEVIVREVLPRPRDERVTIELSKSSQQESDLARWKQDREERGIHTWLLRVPAGEKGIDLLWQRTISFPKGAVITVE